MGKAKRKPNPEEWTEKHGCDGRPPILVDGIADTDVRRARVVRNANHSTLSRMHHLGYLKDRVSDNAHEARVLSDLRFAAGERLQNDHAQSGQETIKGTLSSLEGGGSACGPAEIAQMRIDADKRKETALNAVGRSARFLLEAIVIKDQNAHDVAKTLRMDKQGVMPALRVSLDALAAHYGLTSDARGHIRGGEALPIDPLHPFQDYC